MRPAYQAAEQLGKAMAENGWFVVTGAATGIMEAGHRGAGRNRSMGLNIMLPFEQDRPTKSSAATSKLVTMKYFFTRKLMFVKECDAVVCLPGGFGTLDEAFEVLTLLQTGKRELMPLVFLDAPGGSFWKDWLAYIRKHLLDGKMISPEDLSLFRVTDSVEETVDEILRFYRVFDSMEYVNNRLVLRLQAARSPMRSSCTIQRDFADILTDGEFRQEAEPAVNGATPTSPHARGSRSTSTAAASAGCESFSIRSTAAPAHYIARPSRPGRSPGHRSSAIVLRPGSRPEMGRLYKAISF